MTEVAKRLEPTKETIRELFVKSGNECAFPGCTRRIINHEGVYIAEMCHIEAAEPGGERFNKFMTNEQRRHVSNLMLMCHEHHVITNDVKKYPIEVLKEMKGKHEAAYTSAPEVIHSAIVDEAVYTHAKSATSLARMSSILEWDLTPEQLQEANQDVAELITRLRNVPTRTRQVLVSIVRRAGEARIFDRGSTVPCAEIENACRLEGRSLNDHLIVLDRYGIAFHDKDDDDFSDVICLRKLADISWDFWSDLKAFCEKTGNTLDEFIVDLRFDLLD